MSEAFVKMGVQLYGIFILSCYSMHIYYVRVTHFLPCLVSNKRGFYTKSNTGKKFKHILRSFIIGTGCLEYLKNRILPIFCVF